MKINISAEYTQSSVLCMVAGKVRFPFKRSRNKRKRQPIGMLGRSSGNHDWLLANASACVSCGFRLRNARNASDCVWMETGLSHVNAMNGTDHLHDRPQSSYSYRHTHCTGVEIDRVLRTSCLTPADTAMPATSATIMSTVSTEYCRQVTHRHTHSLARSCT